MSSYIQCFSLFQCFFKNILRIHDRNLNVQFLYVWSLELMRQVLEKRNCNRISKKLMTSLLDVQKLRRSTKALTRHKLFRQKKIILLIIIFLFFIQQTPKKKKNLFKHFSLYLFTLLLLSSLYLLAWLWHALLSVSSSKQTTHYCLCSSVKKKKLKNLTWNEV